MSQPTVNNTVVLSVVACEEALGLAQKIADTPGLSDAEKAHAEMGVAIAEQDLSLAHAFEAGYAHACREIRELAT